MDGGPEDGVELASGLLAEWDEGRSRWHGRGSTAGRPTESALGRSG